MGLHGVVTSLAMKNSDEIVTHILHHIFKVVDFMQE
jgi:hypothetical protein